MIELFAYKQIRCEHCGFEFSFTGFGSAAKIVCPACGEENVSFPPPVSEAAIQLEAAMQALTSDKAVPDESASPPTPPPVVCSVEHCPLLTGEPGNAVAGAITEQMEMKIHQKKKRRRTILAWTVTLQVCVLFGVVFFIAQTLMVPKEKPAVPTGIESAAATTTLPEIVPSPLPAVPETKTAIQNPLPDIEPFAPIVEPNLTVSPFGLAQDIFPPSVQEDLPLDNPHGDEYTMVSISEAIPPPPPTVKEQATLAMAENFLETAKTTLTTDPENSIEQAVRAAKIYEQLGQPLPGSIYWILSNAFASLAWGEPLLESSPAIETMTLSADSRWLLAQLKDKTVRLWDLHSPAEDRSEFLLDSGTAEYIKFVFTPDLRWIIGGQKNGTIRVWDMYLKNPGETMITFSERIPDLQDLQISPNGQWLAAFGNAPPDAVVSSDQPSHHLSPSQPIQQVSHQRSDRLTHYTSTPYPVLLWNLRQMEPGVVPIAMLVPPVPSPVQVIQFSPNSNRLAVSRKETDSIVRIYDLTSRGVSDEPFILRGHQFAVTQIAFAPNGQWVATGSQDNTVRLWNLTSSKVALESVPLYGHIGWISALAVDQTGEYLFSGSYDRTIRIWNIKQDRVGTALNTNPVILEADLGVLESIALTRDGDKMIALGSEGSLGIYHLPSLLEGDSAGDYQAVTFRNGKLAVSEALLTADDQLLIFSYEHLSNPSNCGIRLWPLQPQAFVQ